MLAKLYFNYTQIFENTVLKPVSKGAMLFFYV